MNETKLCPECGGNMNEINNVFEKTKDYVCPQCRFKVYGPEPEEVL